MMPRPAWPDNQLYEKTDFANVSKNRVRPGMRVSSCPAVTGSGDRAGAVGAALPVPGVEWVLPCRNRLI
jgi:hypothetical protein